MGWRGGRPLDLARCAASFFTAVRISPLAPLSPREASTKAFLLIFSILSSSYAEGPPSKVGTSSPSAFVTTAAAAAAVALDFPVSARAAVVETLASADAAAAAAALRLGLLLFGSCESLSGGPVVFCPAGSADDASREERLMVRAT